MYALIVLEAGEVGGEETRCVDVDEHEEEVVKGVVNCGHEMLLLNSERSVKPPTIAGM